MKSSQRVQLEGRCANKGQRAALGNCSAALGAGLVSHFLSPVDPHVKQHPCTLPHAAAPSGCCPLTGATTPLV